MILLLAGCGGGGGGGVSNEPPTREDDGEQEGEVDRSETEIADKPPAAKVNMIFTSDSDDVAPITITVTPSLTERQTIPVPVSRRGGRAPLLTVTIIIPRLAAAGTPAVVTVISPAAAGKPPLTTTLGFSLDDLQPLSIRIAVPPLPRLLSPAAVSAQKLPLRYLHTRLTTDTESLNSESYHNERQYNVTLVGAHRLHWSRLEASGESAGEPGPFIRGAGVTVGIVDTGIDTDHPDLKDNVLIITTETVKKERHIEDKGRSGHGTQVAGVIAARLNGKGVVGVAPEAKLLAVNEERISLEKVYSYMAANNAFVVNNSWGEGIQWIQVSVAASVLYDSRGGKAAGLYWLSVPAQFEKKEYVRQKRGWERLERPLAIDYKSKFDALRRAAEQDILLVFSNGNGGWNSETGKVDYCYDGKASCGENEILLADSAIVSLTVYGYVNFKEDIHNPPYPFHYKLTDGRSTVIRFGENVIDVIKRMPVDYLEKYSKIAQNWINVASIDRNRRIAAHSNGCGVAKDYCLAAPGVDIITTKKDGGLTKATGTSVAAPHVSGAAALLKGAFPMLTPQQVRDILLESADEMGSCRDVAKARTCADEVYGHGILNIPAAFTPASFIELSAGTGVDGAVVKSGFDIAASRIQLSPAFGAAPWRQESFNVGGLDDYGRVFYTHLDLSDGVYVSKPLVGEDREVKGAGLHRAYAPPLSRPVAAVSYIAADELASAQWRQSAAGIGYGGSQSPHHQSHFVSSRLGNSRFAWHTRLGRDSSDSGGLGAAAGYWQAPFDDGSVHQLQWDYLPAAAAAAQVGIMLGGGDGVRQTAARLQWQGADWTWTAEGGVVREASQVLGASFTGAFSVKGTDTVYRRLRGVYQPASGLHLFADYMQSDSEADGGGGIVRALDARAEAWEAGLSYQRWRFAVSQPLAITAGGLDLSYISGYTAAGAYAVTERRLDLSSGQRARRASLLYVREAIDGLSVALGLDVWRHAPARGYAGNSVVVSGALRYQF